jgi:hypothetical protein
VANEAPELFGGLVAEVPFVDCVTTMLDDELPLTVGEWEEWGNPLADESAYRRMLTYSPYDNVTGQNTDGSPRTYPDLFVTAGLNDPRVAYWEPAKWVAKLRAESPSTKVLLKTELGAGHGGPSGRYDAWKEEAGVVVDDPAVRKWSVNGAWLPGGSVTGEPLTVAVNTPGAPAITVSGPVAAMAWDWPDSNVVVKSTVPVAVLETSTQQSPEVAAMVRE